MGDAVEGKCGVQILEVQANGMTFRCRASGVGDAGEPVILLHGFPESSAMWVPAMELLASRGYRCFAPDQRGYSPKARPKDKLEYRLDLVASDVVALAGALGLRKFHLVGHDWGAACGWTVVQLYPERVQSWTALSLPHMAAFRRAVRTAPEQKRKSWYIGFFQLPVLPELALGWGALEKLWKGASEDELVDYRSIFRPHGARKAVLNWYRAVGKVRVAFGDVHVPTLMIWGNRDIAIARAGVEDTRRYMKGDYTFVELDAGHWLPRQSFDRVTGELLGHLGRHPL